VPHVTLKSFEKILPSELIQRLAIENNVDKCNQTKLTGTLLFSCLLHKILEQADGEITQRSLASAYYNETGDTVDHSSFGKRFDKIPVSFFKDIFEYLFNAIALELPPPTSTKGMNVRFVDATIVSMPAGIMDFGLLFTDNKQKPARREVKAVYSIDENGLPKFLRLCTDKREHNDSVALGDPILATMNPHELCVFDAGVRDRFRLLLMDNANSYFLTRQSIQTLNTVNIVYEDNMLNITEDAPGKGRPTYQLNRVEECRFGNSREADKKKFENLPIIAFHGRRWDSRAEKWSSLVLMTNLRLDESKLKAGPYTFMEVAELYRKRWDIETFFKFIKKNLGYKHFLSRSKNGIEVMIYMTLIAGLLMIWYKKFTGIHREGGWPEVKRDLYRDCKEWIKELVHIAYFSRVVTQKNRPLRI